MWILTCILCVVINQLCYISWIQASEFARLCQQRSIIRDSYTLYTFTLHKNRYDWSPNKIRFCISEVEKELLFAKIQQLAVVSFSLISQLGNVVNLNVMQNGKQLYMLHSICIWNIRFVTYVEACSGTLDSGLYISWSPRIGFGHNWGSKFYVRMYLKKISLIPLVQNIWN